MGGKESKDIQRNDISNEIKTTIKNDTANISKQYSKTISDVSTSLISEQSASASNQVDCSNMINLSGGTISGSKLRIDQACKVDSTTRAIMSIISTQASLSDFANKISAQVQQNTQNNTALQAALKSTNNLSNATSTQNGLESTITKCMDSLTGILKPGEKCDTEKINTIKNSITMEINNKTVNSSDVSNINSQISKNLSKNVSNLSCKSVTTASNTILAIGTNISNSDLDLKQSSLVTAFNDCIVSAAASSDIINKIATTTLAKSTTDTSNTNKASADNSSTNTASNKSTETSGLVDMIMYIVIGVIAVAVIGGLALVFMPSENMDALSNMGGGSFNWIDNTDMIVS
jgi:hypothetical protein